MGSSNDEAMWAQALRGDAASFAALFDRHRDRVFRHAVYHLGAREDAEDAAASTFLELWRLRDRVVLVDGSVLPWLLATTTNVSRNVGRSRRRYRELLDRLPRDGAVEDDAAVLAQAHLDAQRALAAAAPALKRLSATDHALLMLTAVEDLPVAVAAAAVGVTAGAARTRLHRIKSRLREDMQPTTPEVIS